MPLTVSKNSSRPANLRRRTSGEAVYPLADMKAKDDYFHVPPALYFGDDPEAEVDMERWNPRKHRERVNNAVRAFAQKQNKAAEQAEGYDPTTYKPVRFTVAVEESEGKPTGIGVWRDQ